MGDLCVAVFNLLKEACAKGSSKQLFNGKLVRADAVVIVRNLLGTGSERFIDLVNVGVACRTVPRTILTEYDALAHWTGPPLKSDRSN